MHQGDIADIARQYDVIISFDLIEHILDLRCFIQRCADHLKEDGIFSFQTPCYDNKLSYHEMLKIKPRFKDHMKKEQHIWLFSKSAVERFLKEAGFQYINFEPAVFGDDYDMFVFASRKPIKKNSAEEIQEYLKGAVNGDLIRHTILLYNQREAFQSRIEELNDYIKDKENQNEKDRKFKTLKWRKKT